MGNFSTLFEPNYTILTFLMFKTFFYVELIGGLALLRVFTAKGPSRIAAYITFIIALIGVAAKYVPPLAGLTGTDIGRVASQIVNQGVLDAGSGMALPIIVSVFFLMSSRMRGRRWWGLDAVHFIIALCFFGLWIYTKL